jgi:hypothetical protein
MSMTTTPRITLLALEPRLVFDGALVSTWDHNLDPSHEVKESDHTQELPDAVVVNRPLERRELALIDAGIPNLDALLKTLKPGVEHHLVDAGEDAQAQLLGYLQAHPECNAFHVFGQGAAGVKRLEHILHAIQGPFPPGGELHFYSAEATGSDADSTLIRALTQTTATQPQEEMIFGRLGDQVSDLLKLAQQDAQTHITLWMNQEDAAAQLALIFGDDQPSAQWLQQAQSVVEAFRRGDLSVRVELRNSAELYGVWGAFAGQSGESSPVIYLNADWLNAAETTAQAVGRVLAEEWGHFLDVQLNANRDTAGDEGEAFFNAVYRACQKFRV